MLQLQVHQPTTRGNDGKALLIHRGRLDIFLTLLSHSEAWRYNGPFTRWNRLKGSFPGLGIGAGAFVVYLAYEALFVKDEHGHGEIGHGKDHHGIVV